MLCIYLLCRVSKTNRTLFLFSSCSQSNEEVSSVNRQLQCGLICMMPKDTSCTKDLLDGYPASAKPLQLTENSLPLCVHECLSLFNTDVLGTAGGIREAVLYQTDAIIVIVRSFQLSVGVEDANELKNNQMLPDGPRIGNRGSVPESTSSEGQRSALEAKA